MSDLWIALYLNEKFPLKCTSLDNPLKDTSLDSIAANFSDMFLRQRWAEKLTLYIYIFIVTLFSDFAECVGSAEATPRARKIKSKLN